MIAINNMKDTLYLDASKHLYGIIINKSESEPIFLKPNLLSKEVIRKINEIYNLKK